MTRIIRLAGLLALAPFIGVSVKADAAFKLEGEPKIAFIYASTTNGRRLDGISRLCPRQARSGFRHENRL
jgi:hypothetical protein